MLNYRRHSKQEVDLLSIPSSGTSSEGRPLKVLKVGTEGRGLRKPSIWIDGGEDFMMYTI